MATTYIDLLYGLQNRCDYVVTTFTQPAVGQITVDNGMAKYVNNTTFTGTTSFTYTVMDRSGNSDTATITLNADPGTCSNCSPITIDLESVDCVHPCVGQPTHGTAVVNGNQIKYYPDANGVVGTEIIPVSYYDCSGTVGQSNINIVGQQVLAPDKNIQVCCSSVTIPLLTSQTCGTKLVSHTNPVSGTLTVDNGVALYVPPVTGQVTDDSFTYTLMNSACTKATGTIHLLKDTITVPNRTHYVCGPTTIPLLDGVTTVCDSKLELTVDVVGIGTIASGEGYAVYTPPVTGMGGQTVVSHYTVKNAAGTSATGTITLLPYPITAPDRSASFCGDPISIPLTAGIDNSTCPITAELATNVNPDQGSVTVSNNVATFTPATNSTGTPSFTYRLNNGSNISNTATVTLNNLVVAPTISNKSLSLCGNSLTIPLTNDLPSTCGEPQIVITQQPTTGTVSVVNGVATYSLGNAVPAATNFKYKVVKGSSQSNEATVSINPVFNAAQNVSINSCGGRTNIPLSNCDGCWPQRLVSFTQPTQGSVTKLGDNAVYSAPLGGVVGSTTFNYTLASKTGNGTVFGSTTAQVTVSCTLPVQSKQSLVLVVDRTQECINKARSDISKLVQQLGPQSKIGVVYAPPVPPTTVGMPNVPLTSNKNTVVSSLFSAYPSDSITSNDVVAAIATANAMLSDPQYITTNTQVIHNACVLPQTSADLAAWNTTFDALKAIGSDVSTINSMSPAQLSAVVGTTEMTAQQILDAASTDLSINNTAVPDDPCLIVEQDAVTSPPTYLDDLLTSCSKLLVAPPAYTQAISPAQTELIISLTNNVDAACSPVHLFSVGSVSHTGTGNAGSVSVYDDSSALYQRTGCLNGTDTFSYVLKNDINMSVSSTYTIESTVPPMVEGSNNIENLSSPCTAAQSINCVARVISQCGPIILVSNTNPAHGSLAVPSGMQYSTGVLIYTPTTAQGSGWTDQFDFTVQDNAGQTFSDTIHINCPTPAPTEPPGYHEFGDYRVNETNGFSFYTDCNETLSIYSNPNFTGVSYYGNVSVVKSQTYSVWKYNAGQPANAIISNSITTAIGSPYTPLFIDDAQIVNESGTVITDFGTINVINNNSNSPYLTWVAPTTAMAARMIKFRWSITSDQGCKMYNQMFIQIAVYNS